MNPSRRSYILQNVFALGISIAVVMGSIFFWTISDQASSSIRVAFGPVADIWSAIYCLGGILSAVGILMASPRLELAGKSLLAAAFSLQGTAFIAVSGYRALPTACILYFIALACIVRSFVLLQAYRIERGAMERE